MKRLLLVFPMLLLVWGAAIAQRTISGTVTSPEGEPLIGASVAVKGTSTGTVTEVDGSYQLRIPDGSTTLVFSYTGYAPEEIALGNSNRLDVSLSEQATILEDIVVTALGFETKRSKIGVASSTVDGDALVSSGEVGLINSLAGKSAGVNIVQSSGEPGASSRIQIRGATSITGDLQPLIVVDGIPIFNDSYYGQGFGGQGAGSGGSLGSGGGVTQQSRLNDLNPEDIESVEVLRGASAAAVWGSRAANGVLVITTKKGRYNPDKDYTVAFSTSVAIDQINKKVPLNTTYGRGNGMLFQAVPTGGRSWGDKISDRKGGMDNFITDVNDPGYAGQFIANDGTVYYALANGTPDNVHGGKNDTEIFDPYEQLFQLGVTYSNTLSVSTANDKGSVYFSLSNLSQDGIVQANSDFTRTTARLNATRNLGRMFSITANTAYTLSTSNRVQMGSNLNGLFLGGLRSSADFNDDDFEGTYIDAAGNEFPNRQRAYRNYLGANTISIYDNPVWMMNNVLSDTRVNRFLGKLELRFEPLNWLNFTARGGLDTYTDEREDFFPVLAAGSNNGGRFTKETITRRQVNFDFIGRARFDITQEIGLTLLAGVGLNEQRLDDHGTTARAFINPLSPPQLANATNLEVFNLEQVSRTAGLYGTIGLEFFDQVFVNLSGRQDYLSTLPQNNNTVFYPAADVAWQFTKLIPNNSILSSGKLRAGYGQVGRGPDPYLTSTDFYTPTAANTGFGEGWGPGLNPVAYGGAFPQSNVAGNPNLKPEIKTEVEAGVDLGFWNDRFNVGFTYYNNETEDLIIQVSTPESSGFVSQIANAATIENRGFEVEWDLGILRDQPFKWSVYGNFTQNRNEVVDMSGTESLLISGFTGTSSRAVVGEQLGVLWGARWDRDDAGELVLDEDGFPTIAPAAGIIGDPNPDYRMGIGSLVSYKGVSVNVLFDFSQGGDMWNGTKGALAFFGRSANTAVETTLTEAQANDLLIYTGETVAERYPYQQNSDGSYTVRGEISDFGGGEVFLDETWYRIGPGSGFTGPDEQFVEDASWARLRELTVSYAFGNSANLSWLRNASIAFTGRNLILWTDYSGNDPDTNLNGPGNNGFGLDYFQNPSSRTYKLSLNLTF
ncbi:MAG: SusC/RagA family TonB-linked outer membrane protein [Bacteroidota bacterium]